MRSLLARTSFLSPWLVLAACSVGRAPDPSGGTDAAVTESPDAGTGMGGGVDCTQQVTEVQGE